MVIERLGRLNGVYEGRYEGPRDTVFVNGRAKREVMEGALGDKKAQGPEGEGEKLHRLS